MTNRTRMRLKILLAHRTRNRFFSGIFVISKIYRSLDLPKSFRIKWRPTQTSWINELQRHQFNHIKIQLWLFFVVGLSQTSFLILVFFILVPCNRTNRTSRIKSISSISTYQHTNKNLIAVQCNTKSPNFKTRISISIFIKNNLIVLRVKRTGWMA